jgi:uncharacterized protein
VPRHLWWAALLMLALALAAPASQASGEPPAQASGRGWRVSCTVHIVAVSSGGGGVLGNLTVTVEWPGRGRVFISTSPATDVDTQGSARIAALAASMLAGVDVSSLDFYYELDMPSIVVGGPSAGAAMALATLELLETGHCDASVVATGMIQPDTSIGPVGGLKEKLEAAAGGGARLFIVPAGQEVYTYYVEKTRRIGPFTWVVREPVTVNLTRLGESLGVGVEAAATLSEAYQLATGSQPSGSPSVPPGAGWLAGPLEGFVAWANGTVSSLLSGVEPSTRLTAGLAENATQLLGEAWRLAGEGEAYEAALASEEALADALAAEFIEDGLSNNLDVTSAVEEANSTILRGWNLISWGASGPLSSVEALLYVRAYGLLGLAAATFQDALSKLESYGGRYYMPSSLLGGVDVSGVLELARAEAGAYWAMLWANATSAAPPSPSVPPERLHVLANVLVADAKSSVAYLERLLDESGATRGRSLASLATTLAASAASAGDPLEALGLAVESITLATRAIHEAFTLQPGRTAAQLAQTAASIAPQAPSSLLAWTLARAALSMAGSGDARGALEAASAAVLYAWLSGELAGTQQPAPTRAPGSSSPSTTSGAPGGAQPSTHASQRGTCTPLPPGGSVPSASRLALAVAGAALAVAAFAAAASVACRRARGAAGAAGESAPAP